LRDQQPSIEDNELKEKNINLINDIGFYKSQIQWSYQLLQTNQIEEAGKALQKCMGNDTLNDLGELRLP
jgi:hypothetical protein